ncbi:MAG: Zinc ribbon domain [Firmicutes bacterium]|nr:Zinc ribbon domain [Bacillota bacterium]
MVGSNIITRVTASNILRERVWYRCNQCGHKFEQYTELFSQSKAKVSCPQCQNELRENNLAILD